MSLSIQVLGGAGQDNALLVAIDSGQSVSRLLFDCGEDCLDQVRFGDTLAIDHLCFSHLHMDHVAGFDSFFRRTYSRTDRPNQIWGPPGTAEILHHRFQGFLWNLVTDQQATWRVHDVHPGLVRSTRFELAERFACAHPDAEWPWSTTILAGPGYTVEALQVDHGTPSIAYVVRETPRINVDTARLAARGLRPGPWLQRVRGPKADVAETVDVGGQPHSLRELQDALITQTAGDSVAYLTDFLLDESAELRLAAALRGVNTVVCESQYLHADADLARRNRHMTAMQVASLARRAHVGQLILFHLSDRYRPAGWRDILAEAQAIFPATTLPDHWGPALDAE